VNDVPYQKTVDRKYRVLEHRERGARRSTISLLQSEKIREGLKGKKVAYTSSQIGCNPAWGGLTIEV